MSEVIKMASWSRLKRQHINNDDSDVDGEYFPSESETSVGSLTNTVRKILLFFN